MEWRWSQGTYGPGAWVIICRNVKPFGTPSCLMAGEPFTPATYAENWAWRRAMHLIRAAHAGIIYHNPAGTVEQWIAEGVRLGIVPPNWREWGNEKQG